MKKEKKPMCELCKKEGVELFSVSKEQFDIEKFDKQILSYVICIDCHPDKDKINSDKRGISRIITVRKGQHPRYGGFNIGGFHE